MVVLIIELDPYLNILFGGQNRDCFPGTVDLTGTAAHAVLLVDFPEAVRALVDTLHQAKHGAVAAAGTGNGVDDRQGSGFPAEGMNHLCHQKHLPFVFIPQLKYTLFWAF